MQGEEIQTAWANDSFWKLCWVRWDSRTVSKDAFYLDAAAQSGRAGVPVIGTPRGDLHCRTDAGHPGSATHGSRSHPVSSNPLTAPQAEAAASTLRRGAHGVSEGNQLLHAHSSDGAGPGPTPGLPDPTSELSQH